MAPSGFTLRRATLDDLETLRGLWREARLPEHELDKRFTEFQLAVDRHDWILAALGLRFAGAHAEVHSLAIRRADQEAELCEALWQRVLQLSQQQGAYRLWSRIPGEFWSDRGFAVAAAAIAKELPPSLGAPTDAWRTLKLRDEPLKLIAAEEQLEAFLEMERLKTDRLVQQSRFLKILALGFAAVVFAVLFGSLFYLLRKNRASRPRQP